MIPRILCWLVGHRWIADSVRHAEYLRTGHGLEAVLYCARCGAR